MTHLQQLAEQQKQQRVLNAEVEFEFQMEEQTYQMLIRTLF
jgi:hypothetical protein